MKCRIPPIASTVAILLSTVLTSCSTLHDDAPLPPAKLRGWPRTKGVKRTGDGKREEVTIQQLTGDATTDYQVERSYIAQRQRLVHAAGQPLVGLAVSGGGLRSASFNLGVFEALAERDVLPRIDYISSVSGGSYISAWLVTHLEHEGQDGLGQPSYIRNPKELLCKGSIAIEELRARGGFVVGEYGERLPQSIGQWILGMPINFVFDVGLHWKPSRGKFNWHHPVAAYRHALRETFLVPPREADGGKPRRMVLEDLNKDGSAAPYLIMNASMSNGRLHTSPRVKDYPGVITPHQLDETFPFEFTRDRIGSPAIGFIETPHFDSYVHDVKFNEHGQATSATISDRPRVLYGLPMGIMKKEEVATAVAASGAAVSGSSFQNPWVSGLFGSGLLPLIDLDLHYQARNFAASWNRPWELPLDFLREVTIDRILPTRHSNTLSIADGGHYDNLGVTALVQRQVPTILISDATQDVHYLCDDLFKTAGLVTRMKSPRTGERYSWRFDGIAEFHWDERANDLVCESLGDRKPLTPRQMGEKIYVRTAGSHQFAFVGRIYSPQKPADSLRTIYIKSRPLDKAVMQLQPPYVRKYATNTKDFPQANTFDLHYSPRQLDSYRAVGQWLGREMAKTWQASNRTPSSRSEPRPIASTKD